MMRTRGWELRIRVDPGASVPRWGARRGALVVAAAALLLVGCGAGGTVPDPSSASRDTPVSAEGTEPGTAVPEGVGAPLRVQPVDGVSLDSLVVQALGSSPSGEVWVAAGERNDERDVLATGVWHGTAGRPGTWYALGSVEGLKVAPDGRVWVVTGTALATFDDGVWRRVLTPDGAVLSGVPGGLGGATNLAVGPDGAVWANRRADLVRFDGAVTPSTAGPTYVDVMPGPYVPLSSTVAVTSDGTVWTADGTGWGFFGGLVRWDGWAWTLVKPWGSRDLSVFRLAADTDGGLWALLLTCERDENAGGVLDVCDRAHLGHYDGTAWTFRSPGPWSGASDVSMVAVGGSLWMVADGRLSLHDPGDGGFLQVPVPNSGDQRVAAVLAADPGGDGAVWVTTSDGALHRVPPLPQDG